SLSRTVSALPTPDAYYIDRNLCFDRSDRFSFLIQSKGVFQDAESNIGYITLEAGGFDRSRCKSKAKFVWGVAGQWLNTGVEIEDENKCHLVARPGNGIIKLSRLSRTSDIKTLCYYPNKDFVGLDCFVVRAESSQGVANDTSPLQTNAAPVQH